MKEQEKIIEFENLSIHYIVNGQPLKAVNDVSLSIGKGSFMAIVGESGSGKSTLVSSLLSTISSPGIIANGTVRYNENGNTFEIPKLFPKDLQKFRWEKISMVFQASQSTLNPLMTIGKQFYETAYYHGATNDKKAYEANVRGLLEYVKLDPERILKSYPHQLSGGMKQRVMIAFALLLNPQVMVLDEPTTALDVITQSYIFSKLKDINVDKGITMILLTHDIGVVAKYCDHIAVMYGGQMMEYGTVEEVFRERLNPYTKGLIKATPSLLSDIDDMAPIPGMPPNIKNLPKGCPFAERCPNCMNICKNSRPSLIDNGGHLVACHLYGKEGKQ